MENSKYEIIVNCLTRGRYPAGISNEQKRAVRRKVADRSANNTNSYNKFVAKDGVCIFLTTDPMDLGYTKEEQYGWRKKWEYFKTVTKLRLVRDSSRAIRRTEKFRRDFIGTAL